ncbi:MAG TPA: hypothetical protein PLW02_13205 [Verrucomicrobiota bacterium]|nr:hypothetical protein [Verrucomicrobiota bacterium]
MKTFVIFICIISIALCGCKSGLFSKKSQKTTDSQKVEKNVPSDKKTKTTPNQLQIVLSGRIKSVNEKGGFVIISFPLGKMPMIGQRLWVYRDGNRVGVVKITGPQMDFNIAADIIDGEAKIDDEVRLE